MEASSGLSARKLPTEPIPLPILDKRLLSQEISEAQQKISESEISDKQRYLLSHKI